MTESQRKAMIEFHRKAESAYLKYGNLQGAQQARKMREQLENKAAEGGE